MRIQVVKHDKNDKDDDAMMLAKYNITTECVHVYYFRLSLQYVEKHEYKMRFSSFLSDFVVIKLATTTKKAKLFCACFCRLRRRKHYGLTGNLSFL